MYAGTRRYNRRRRKRAEIRGYLRTLVWVLTVICILVVAAAMAVHQKWWRRRQKQRHRF